MSALYSANHTMFRVKQKNDHMVLIVNITSLFIGKKIRTL